MKELVPKKTHLLYLDGIRALAAVYVVAHHAILQFYYYDTKDLTGIKKILISVFFLGHFSVDVFIVLSGYCLMIPVVKSNYKLKGGVLFFYTKRAVRIIPTYYIAIGFSLLLIEFLIGNKTGTLWDISIPVTKQAILADLLFVQDCFYDTHTKINFVFWSIGVETRIYILFPLIVLLYRKLDAIWTILLSVITSIAIHYFLIFINSFDNIFTIDNAGLSPYLILFTLGMISADICFAKEPKFKLLKNLPWNKIFLAITLLVALLNKLLHKDVVIWQEVDVAGGVWTMCLLIVCFKETFNPSKAVWIKKFLSWQPVAFVGTFAYSLYLIHVPLLQVVTQYIILPLHLSLFNAAISILLIGLPICIGCAYLFFILFEKPFLNLGKKVTLKITEAHAAINPAI